MRPDLPAVDAPLTSSPSEASDPDAQYRPATLTASGLRRAELCPASFALPVAHDRGSERPRNTGDTTRADRGTYVHRVLELRVRGASLADALDTAHTALGRRPHWSWVDWASAYDPADLLPPGYAWIPETRWYLDCGPLLVGGTPDVFGVRGQRGVVVDWKTHKPRDRSNLPAQWQARAAAYDEETAHTHQLQAEYHALAALATAPQLASVTTDVIYLGPPAARGGEGQLLGHRSETYERGSVAHRGAARRLALIGERVSAARSASPVDQVRHANPGLHCVYCPAKGGCEAYGASDASLTG